MTYALGRTLEYYDMPAVRKIVHAAAADDYRFSTIVRGVVQSEQFRMRRVPAPDTSAPAETTSDGASPEGSTPDAAEITARNAPE